jgi:hypothetical protein
MPIAAIGTGGGGGGDGGGSGADDLADVTLASFTANPAAIGPFDTSTLQWSVHGVKPRVRVLLDTTEVTAAGSAVVQPAVSAGYTLSAASGLARKTLGHATVDVERSTCSETEMLNLLANLRTQLFDAIANPKDPKFKTFWPPPAAGADPLSVTLSDEQFARIVIHMSFLVEIPKWYSPNLSVTLDLSFGLAVVNGAFIAVVPTSEASVNAGVIGWLLGPYVMFALAMAQSDAVSAGFKIIQALITYVNMIEYHPDVGKAARSAIAEYRNGAPFVGYVQCALGTQGQTLILSETATVASARING